MTEFVIVVDMQRDFVMASGALPVPDAEMLIEPMQHWLATLNAKDVAGVLLTFDTHEQALYAGSPEANEFPIHCERGTDGWQSVLDTSLIDPAIPVYTLEKGVFNMWAEPDLVVRQSNGADIARDVFFDQLVSSGVDQFSVTGVAADYCVRWTVDGLVRRGYAVKLHGSLTRGIALSADDVSKDFKASGKVRLV